MAPSEYMDAIVAYQQQLLQLAEEAEAQAESLRAMAFELKEQAVTDLIEHRSRLEARHALAEHIWQHALGVWFYARALQAGVRGVVSTTWAAVERAWRRVRPAKRD